MKINMINSFLNKNFNVETNVRYINLYGGNSKIHFVLNKKTAVFVRQQTSNGTTDQKYPYFYLDCLTRVPYNNVVFILDCDGASYKSVNWLSNKCKNTTEKNMEVVNINSIGKNFVEKYS